MKSLTFYIVDVFAPEKYAGNQLAVFRDAGGLAGAEMQRLAKEMNYSETTFILSEEATDGGYDVRIFTPDKEIPFAGHPTLGTAYIIQREIIRSPVEEVTLNLKMGRIPVTFAYDGDTLDGGTASVLWMRQQPATAGKVVDPGVMAAILGLEEEDIDPGFPCQESSTGLPFLIVPLKTLAALKRAKIDHDRMMHLVNGLEAKAILAFCPEPYVQGHDIGARVFAGYYGVPEDPATGSANGCLAGYLVYHTYFGKDEIDVKVDQGFEIGRPSLLMLKARRSGDEIEVNVGGAVVMVAEGRLRD
ncbi:PhzF family phenazine biosynthesis protein [Candidatus Eisenbacteria bacterium]|uniref:PhzF family phenazine biosynthesis protein n=1 Tax=Eiseniibacteriota bacterium TaxID=2212470 RepID=A0ABV6YPF1_UNCEI